MSGGEWRRGGDPANPPIDRVGVWERKNQYGIRRYQVHSLDRGAGVLRQEEDGSWRPSYYDNLGDLLLAGNCEWSFVEPLADNGESCVSPLPGAREATDKARSERDSLASQLEEARAECERSAKRNALLVSDRSGLRIQVDLLTAERDALKAEVERLNEWKVAVEEHAVVNWNGKALDEPDPYKAIGLLVEHALDQERDQLRNERDALRSRLSAQSEGETEKDSKWVSDHIDRLWMVLNVTRQRVDKLESRQ